MNPPRSATLMGTASPCTPLMADITLDGAISDHSMPYEKYFMLNAAVAMEAYDPTGGITQESHDNMTPDDWTAYADRVRSTHWFELFPQGDGRRQLTWKGRFANVTDIVNFYSTQDEVVNNGDGQPKTLLARNYVWYNQETRKGLWPFMLHEYEGGWAFNAYYDIPVYTWIGDQQIEEMRHLTPAETDDLTDGHLRQNPFFLGFNNPEMCASTNGAFVATNYLYRAEMFAYAIPAESYAVGANPLPSLDDIENLEMIRDGNYDMAVLFHSAANEIGLSEAEKKWVHSTFVQRSYRRAKDLFRSIISLVKEGDSQ